MTHDIETELLSLEDRRCAALIQGDVAGLAELLSDDLLWTHWSARQDTKSSFLAALAKRATRYLEIDRSEEDIRVPGDVAVITGVADMRAIVNGEEKVLCNRYLNVWTRDDGRWRMSAWQSTNVPLLIAQINTASGSMRHRLGSSRPQSGNAMYILKLPNRQGKDARMRLIKT